MAPDLRERTIADFGEQWTIYRDNPQYYGSADLLRDVFGPLLTLESIRGSAVVDVGAGTGRFTRIFAESGARRVYAVEPSAAYDVLVANTAGARDRVECLHVGGEEFRLPEAVDLAFSFGVLHHIPNPAPVVSAMYDSLKPGGRAVVWLYGHEGNALYVSLLRFLLPITRRLPHAMLVALVWLLYAPIALYIAACRYVRLPMWSYVVDVFGQLTPAMRRLTMYDQLNPSYAKYYRKEEVRSLLADAGFTDIQLFHRHAYSWTAVAIKR